MKRSDLTVMAAMTAAVLVAATTLSVTTIGIAQPAHHPAATQDITLAAGTNAVIRCAGPGETWNAHGYPLDDHCPGGPPATTTTVPATTSTTTPPAPGGPPALLMTDSLFLRNVSSWPIDSQSANFAADFVAAYKVNYGTVGVNTAPIYAIPPGTPESPVSTRSGCNDFTSSTGNEVPIPSFVHLNGSGDNPLMLYSTSLNRVWEFWQMAPSGNGYTACWGGSATLTSFSGVFPQFFGLSATGIAYLATMITEADVASGHIDHAISMILPPANCNTDIYPADRGDCSNHPGQPSEGQWFRFPPGESCGSGCSTPFAKMVFAAIQAYGLVVNDQGGAIMLEAEQSSDWAAEGHSGTDPITASWQGQQEYQVVANLPWSSLQTVDPPVSLHVPGLPFPLPKPFYKWPGKHGKA